METVKSVLYGVFGLAAMLLYIVIASMLGVLPIMGAIWIWQKILG